MERQLWTMVGAIASIALALGVVALPADAATRPYCGLRWGSLQKQIGRGPGFPPSPLVGVRAGRHACFDRLVFDHDGVIAGGAVRYVSRVTTEAVGDPVPLRGGAFLQIVLYAPNADVALLPTDVVGGRRVSRGRHRVGEPLPHVSPGRRRRLVRGLHDGGPRRARPASLPCVRPARSGLAVPSRGRRRPPLVGGAGSRGPSSTRRRPGSRAPDLVDVPPRHECG